MLHVLLACGAKLGPASADISAAGERAALSSELLALERARARLSAHRSGGGRSGQAQLTASINKTWDSPVKFALFAGIEGTGHHMVASWLEACDRTICVHDPRLSQLIWRISTGKNEGLFAIERSGVDAIRLRIARRLKLVERMHAAANGGRGAVVLLNMHPDNRATMWSYPNLGGVQKSLQHPDVSQLAAVADFAGVDLRIVVVTRSAADALASALKRGFGGSVSREGLILTDNAHALAGQLATLDAEYYFCIDPLATLESRASGSVSGLLRFVMPQYAAQQNITAPILAAFNRARSSRRPRANVSSSARSAELSRRFPSFWHEAVRLGRAMLTLSQACP